MLWRRNAHSIIDCSIGQYLFKSNHTLYRSVLLYSLLAQMAKLVDALLSGGSAERCAGSNPVLGTKGLFLIVIMSLPSW